MMAWLLVSASGVVHAGLFDDDVARKQIAEQTRRLDDTRAEVRAEFKSQADALKAQADALSATNARLAKMEEAMRGSLITQQSMLELVNQIELLDRKSTRLNSSHVSESRMPSSA